MGIVCKQRNKMDEAKYHLVNALNAMPCLWSAWLELAPMLDHKDRALVLIDRIQDHWMKNFLMASFHLDVH